MAFTGAHVVWSYAGSENQRDSDFPLAGPAVVSETLAEAGTSSKFAPPSTELGDPVYTVIFSVDAYFAMGKEPDAEDGTRWFVPANKEKTGYCKSGDKLAWKAA